jgi:hypothetical protein
MHCQQLSNPAQVVQHMLTAHPRLDLGRSKVPHLIHGKWRVPLVVVATSYSWHLQNTHVAPESDTEMAVPEKVRYEA